jgi:TolB-like protein
VFGRKTNFNPNMDYYGIGLATELAIEIARFQDVQVMRYKPESRKDYPPKGSARFAIGGNVRKDDAEIKVAVHLTDTTNHIHIWGDMYQSDLEAAQLIAFQEYVARLVVAKITSQSGILAKTLSIESKNLRPSDLNAYDAVLRYYEFDSKFTPDTFYRTFELLKIATAKEPGFALVWSMLARLYANNHSLELFDVETPLEEASAFT